MCRFYSVLNNVLIVQIRESVEERTAELCIVSVDVHGYVYTVIINR